MDNANLAGRETRLCGGLKDLHGEFVAHPPGILQEGMLTLEDMVVGAADTDPARTNQRMPGIRPRGGSLLELQAAWCGANKGIYELHGTRCRSLESAPIASGVEEGPAQRRPLRSLTGNSACCP